MRYLLNVYRPGFVYIDLRFYTAWARSGRRVSAFDELSLSPKAEHHMTKSSVRTEVQELQKLGPLPSEDEAEIPQLERIEALYRAIARPITDDEAHILVELFGTDGCYGFAFSFIHLIETAPGWPLKDCLEQLNNEWKVELRNRAIRGGYQL
jgi:hypothetical protein